MYFSQIIKTLYGSNLHGIYQILEQSIHISKADRSTGCLHTGFTFENQKQTRFELLIQASNQTIYQPIRYYNQTPSILGLLMGCKNGDYYDVFYNVVLLSAYINNDNWGQKATNLVSRDMKPQDFNHKFKLLDDCNETVHELPLSKHFNETVFNTYAGLRRPSYY